MLLGASDGRKYVGERKHDKANGKGTYYWPSGDKYEGDFRNDKMHGNGKYTWVRAAPVIDSGRPAECCQANGTVFQGLDHCPAQPRGSF